MDKVKSYLDNLIYFQIRDLCERYGLYLCIPNPNAELIAALDLPRGKGHRIRFLVKLEFCGLPCWSELKKAVIHQNHLIFTNVH